jgi:hypothetical protein
MAGAPDITDWLASIARDLVDHTDKVWVEAIEEDGATVLELTVDEEELGRVIGRQGRTAQALRTLLDVAGELQGRHYELEILE